MVSERSTAISDCGATPCSASAFAAAAKRAAQGAWRVFQDTHERDEDGRPPDELAADALALAGAWLQQHRGSAAAAIVRARLQHALSVAEPNSATALRLRARLVAERDFATGDSSGILAVVAESRTEPDAIARADVLRAALQCLFHPDDGARRLELAGELTGLSVHTGREVDILMGALFMTCTMLLEGDVRAERGLAELRALATSCGHQDFTLAVRAIDVTLAVRAGRLAEAERLAEACDQHARQARHPEAPVWWVAQLVMIRWFQGRTPELIPMLEKIANSPTLSTVDYSYISALAMARALGDDRRGARSALAKLTRRGLANLPKTCNWLTMMSGVATTARLLGDVDVSRESYELLLPYAHRPAMAGLGVACFGSVHSTLGAACLTMGEVDDAVEHFRLGILDNEILEHWPAVALSRRQYAYALSLRGGPDDASVAKQVLTAAVEDARRVGIPLPGPRSALELAQCVRDGDRWTISWKRRTVSAEDSVGMRHLAMLLANPGAEIPATDLAAGMPGAKALTGLSGDQPVLDQTALAQYRQRLVELEAVLASSGGRDGQRASEARAERDWLLAELGGARGVRGQTRGFADNAERARIAVTRAIQRALERIEQNDALIGGHLRSAVSTGGRCCYRGVA